jgi:hypothetical protein
MIEKKARPFYPRTTSFYKICRPFSFGARPFNKITPMLELAVRMPELFWRLVEKKARPFYPRTTSFYKICRPFSFRAQPFNKITPTFELASTMPKLFWRTAEKKAWLFWMTARPDWFYPLMPPRTGAFEQTNRQDSRFVCVAPEGRGTWMYRVSSPLDTPQGALFGNSDQKASARRVYVDSQHQ